MTGNRDLVCMYGQVPVGFENELTARGLRLHRCNSFAEFSEAAVDPRCRAANYVTDSPHLLDRAEQELNAVLTQVTPVALQCGVMVTVAVISDKDDATRPGWAFVTGKADAAATTLGYVDPKHFRPRIIEFQQLNAGYAQECLLHQPGRPWRDIRVVDDRLAAPPEEALPLTPISPEEKRLLQRAFSDYDLIRVRLRQNRGHSVHARRVYEVRPHVENGPEVMPFLVKTAKAEAIERELGATQIACGDHTPFVHFPPLVHNRRVTGHTRAALVSNFIERAVLLETYITTHSPAVAIASLFDGPLRTWRSHSQIDKIALGKDAKEKGYVWFKPEIYRAAFEAARSVNPKVRGPQTLLKALEAVPEMDVRVCRSHGDLHLRNVFVRENSVDVMLIDFNRAGLAPASRDPAELEVSLAFLPPKRGEIPLSPAEIDELYNPPLLGRLTIGRRSHPRALAIEQVRRQVVGTVQEAEYKVMVGAHCLYYARKKSGSLAYLAADRLI